MNLSRLRHFFIFVLLFTVLLVGCNSVMERVIPPPTNTSTPSPTPTSPPTFTAMPTLTFTPPPPPVQPSPTVTFFPTATFATGPTNTPTPSKVPTDYVGMIRPIASAKFRGNFSGGNIVFSTNAEADRVGGLTINFKCWGDNYTLNLSRTSMKISNSTFTYGMEGVYVQGAFTSSTTAKGVFNYELEKGGKTCSYSYQGWTADMK